MTINVLSSGYIQPKLPGCPHCAGVNDWICSWWRRIGPDVTGYVATQSQYLDIYTVSTQYLHSIYTVRPPVTTPALDICCPRHDRGGYSGCSLLQGKIYLWIKCFEFEKWLDVKLSIPVQDMLTLSRPSSQYLPLRPMVGISWHPTKYCTGTAGCCWAARQCGALQLTPHLNGFTKTDFIPNFTAQIVLQTETTKNAFRCLLFLVIYVFPFIQHELERDKERYLKS